MGNCNRCRAEPRPALTYVSTQTPKIMNPHAFIAKATLLYVAVALNAGIARAQSPIVTQDTGTADFGPITNIFAFVGGNVNFYAAFDGTPPITNQWLVKLDSGGDYTPVAGAASNSWTLVNVQPSSAGNYKLAATNAVGSSNSTPAHLTALADPAAPPSNGVTNMYSYCVYTNHPWAYWKFEETNDTLTSSMQAYDYSGHNFDATYGNSDGSACCSGCKDGGESEIYGPTHFDGYPGFPANNGCATMSYNWDNGYLTVPPLNLNINTVTFLMWIYPNSDIILPSTGLLMNRNGTDAAGIGFGLNVQTDDEGRSMAELGYTWNTISSATYNWHSGLYPIGATWNFVACVITPSNTTMYLYYISSGASGLTTNLLKAVNNATNASEAFSGGTTWIGGDNWSNGRTFDGSIDEVAVFTNFLSEARIQDLFLKALGLPGLPPPPPPWPVEPTNTTLFQGQTLQLTAIAGAAIPTLWYQWWAISNGIPPWKKFAGGTNSTLVISNYELANYMFRAIATNIFGSTTSRVATVTLIPVPNWNKGLWTVNFSVTSTNNGGTGLPYVGRGVLGTNFYWNALRGSQFTNTPPSLLDDGVTISGINRGVNFGSTNNVWAQPWYVPGDNPLNSLLDTYCDFGTNGAAFVFTSVPNGTYNLALYGIDGAYADHGTIFTVYGGSQSVTNAQDAVFLPDNTVIYTNLLVTNGKLEVDMMPVPSIPSHPHNTEGAFNGAQLQLITWGPNILSLTNRGTNLVLTYVGGILLSSTNISGPTWLPNSGSPYVFAPTGQMRFFKVYSNPF